MSQKGVECLIGRLITDRAMRERFERDRLALLANIRNEGYDLNAFEVEVLRKLDAGMLERFSSRLDGVIQRAPLAAWTEPEDRKANGGER